MKRRSGMRWVLTLAMGVGLGAVVIQPAAAQSTIFNIPTTDTVAPHKGYFEFDYLVQLPKPDQGQWQVIMPRIVIGVTPMLEVGLNSANTRASGATAAYIQPNAKYKFFMDDDKGLAAAAGIIGYIPVNYRDSLDTFGMVYGNISKKMKNGARVTAGPYASLGAYDNTGGVILGYEQPVSAKVSFVADWFSGKNFWGYFTPGISAVLPHNGLLNIGYSLGNDSFASPSNKNRAFFIYYGITFP